MTACPATGVSPSFDEMREALDLKSKSGVHRLISALEERQFIRRLPNRARALEVVKMPEVDVAGGRRRMATKAGRPRRRQRHDRNPAARPDRRRHADRGAAGDRGLCRPRRLLGPGEHYALEVSGDSMVEEGILDGDFALIRKVDTRPRRRDRRGADRQ